MQAEKLTNAGEGGGVSGNGNLKESQHYPPGFGRAVSGVYDLHAAELQREAADKRAAAAAEEIPKNIWRRSASSDLWADALLPDVFDHLIGQ